MLNLLVSFFVFYIVHSWSPLDIKYVHVVASNHFDAGYTNTTLNVLNTYFDEYIPLIPNIGNELASLNVSWVFMEHSWILSLYMQCPPNIGLHCPTETAKSILIEAVNKQQITWYAFPFNSELELYDPSMVEFGTYLSMKQLPSLFSTPHIPTVVSQRDVPGMTRSMIPLFKKSNITAISIGANGRAAPLDVPPVFQWVDPQSDQDIIMIYHGGGYGGTGLESVVMIDNFTHALATYWNGDNQGPPTTQAIVTTLESIQTEFPNAVVAIDTFESFIDALLSESDIVANLPVYTQEFGEIWVYGPPSDPLKLAKFRAASRQRAQCVRKGKCHVESYPFFNFSRLLLKNGEHTFGGSFHFIGENYSQSIWTNDQLQMALNTEPWMTPFNAFRDTWFEQRQFGIDYALDALSQTNDASEKELYNSIMNELNYLQNPSIPHISNQDEWTQIHDIDPTFDVVVNNIVYQVRFDIKTGAIIQLMNSKTGANYVSSLASENDGLGIFMYQTYTEQNFSDFYFEYSIVPDEGCNLDYCKNGMGNAAPWTNTQYNAYSSLLGLYRSAKDKNVFLVECDLGDVGQVLTQQFGAPDKVFVKYNFSGTFDVFESDATENDGFSIELWINNKTYTRLPETMWFAFKPKLKFDQVFVDKSGEYINPNNVVNNGTFHLQSVSPDGSVVSRFNGNKNTIEIYSLDAALSAFVPNGSTEFTDLVTPFIPSDLNQGVSFALSNNFWGTNYPQWYPFDANDANQTYRFNIYLS
eukprot:17007_1